MKNCTLCKIDKTDEEFTLMKSTSGKYVRMARCTMCVRQKHREHHHANKEVKNQKRAEYRQKNYAKEQETWKKHYINNKEEIDIKNKNYYENNKETVLNTHKIYYENNREAILVQKQSYYKLNKEKIDAYRKEYTINNIEKVRAYRNKPDVKLFANHRTRVRKLIGTGKNAPTYLGCSKAFLVEWFKFNINLDYHTGSTLENYGTIWEIDHVIPCSLFDHENNDEVNACFNWSNLYPLVKPKNQEKNTKILQSHIFRQQLRVKIFIKDNKKYNEMNTIDVESCLPQHLEQSNARIKCNGFWMVKITRYGKSAAKPLQIDFLAENDEVEGSETRDLLVSQFEMLKV